MDENNIGVFVCLGVLILIVVVIASVTTANRREELRAFADHWRGQYHDAGFLTGSHVDLDFGGVTARLDFSAGDDEHHTHLTVPLRLPLGRLKLRPQYLGDHFSKFLGMEDIEIGVPEFDEAFVIQGSDSRQIIRLLNEQVRAAIFALKRLRPGMADQLNLVLGSGMLRISVDRYLSTEQELSRFAGRCRALFDLLNPDSSQGIEFIDSPSGRKTTASATIAEAAECLICGAPLKDGVVYCAKCQTPHHRDCWQYFGSCAVYGCGQKRFTESRGRS